MTPMTGPFAAYDRGALRPDRRAHRARRVPPRPPGRVRRHRAAHGCAPTARSGASPCGRPRSGTRWRRRRLRVPRRRARRHGDGVPDVVRPDRCAARRRRRRRERRDARWPGSTDPAVTVVTVTVTEHGYCAVGPGGAARPRPPRDRARPADARTPALAARAPARGARPAARRRHRAVHGRVLRQPAGERSRHGPRRRASSPSAATPHSPSGSTATSPSPRRWSTGWCRRRPTDDRDSCARAGIVDAWPVVTEPFTQWVIEDTFPRGPAAVGAGGRRAGRRRRASTSRPSCGSSTPRTRRSPTGVCSPATDSCGRRSLTRSCSRRRATCSTVR